MGVVRKVVSTVGTLGAIGSAVNGMFVFDLETGVLQQVKIGGLALFDRKRLEARRARRAARRARGGD